MKQKATSNQETFEIGKKEKVAIVGYAPTSRGKAPFTDPEFEIWGVNELYLLIPKDEEGAPRLDVLFEIHDYQWLTQKERNPNHLKWLQENQKIPVFMVSHYDDIPMSFPYPKDEIVAEFGTYFTNSISWMIALAVKVGFKEIHIYGVDMATDTEYGGQRPSVEFFLGVAYGRGVKIFIPPQCDLLKCLHLYGFEDDMTTQVALKIKARKEWLANQAAQHEHNKTQAALAEAHMKGALEDAAYWEKSWLYPTDLRNEGG